MLLAALALIVLLASAAHGYTYTVALDAGEDEYIVCAPGGDLVFLHPARADGSPDRAALVVSCQGFDSPLVQPAVLPNDVDAIYLPLIGG
jgi:hypothetical protein